MYKFCGCGNIVQNNRLVDEDLLNLHNLEAVEVPNVVVVELSHDECESEVIVADEVSILLLLLRYKYKYFD